MAKRPFKTPFIRRPVINLAPDAQAIFPISVLYFMFESIIDLTGTDSDPLLTVELENNIQYTIPALYKVDFNDPNSDPDDLIVQRVRVINQNSFAVSVVMLGGMGNVTSQRSEIVGSLLTTIDWGAAYDTTIFDSSGTGAVSYFSETQVIPAVDTFVTIQGSDNAKRLINAFLVETSGLPGAFAVLMADTSGNPGTAPYLICQPGQEAKLHRGFLTNAPKGKIVVAWLGGAVGSAYGTYENATVSPSGAA